MEETNQSKLIIEIDKEMHKELKMMAIKRNITLRNYCRRALVRALEEEKIFE